MIENDDQLVVTKVQLEKLKYALDHMVVDGSPLISKAQRDGVNSMIAELQQQITDYITIKGRPIQWG